ncbi:LANO_0H03774g1_1 [Lachancea nothofagi CBS 11611]|uniref:Pre-rRNA-processing protein IPI3 n=1 Tax=Lachancea nothofagi CBS 11611 TaxID=1266666 RepID=A0A1G4KLB7_9SACH|nr:LANO_0H03774g1_1 [Lachancea nothofagi CBS 11611]
MEEQLCFTTGSTCTVAFLNAAKQTDLKQCGTEFRNGSVRVGPSHLFVAQRRKALINIYKISGTGSRESVEQRLALPEPVSCLEVVKNVESQEWPYLLLASTPTGKLYVWELGSGQLLTAKSLAHYQPITKIQSIVNGKYVITSGLDSRLMIWQTMDLVTQEDPKPVYTLHDHTLGITDFCVSNAHATTHLSGKLFTVSHDMTLRCYDLNIEVWPQPHLLATFTFSGPLECVTLDSADRACYVGGPQGTHQVNFYYPLGSTKIVNLLSAEGNRIMSCVESQAQENVRELYTMGQIVCPKITGASSTKLACSMDGSQLVVGDSLGKCTVMDIFSKQPLKELHSIVSNESCGEVTSLVLDLIDQDPSESLLATGKSQIEHKFPNLQKNVFTREGLHDVYCQITADREEAVAPLDDFQSYLNQVASEENAFMQLGSVVSTVKVVGQMEHQEEANMEAKVSSESEELTTMKETVGQLTGAYKDLREMYEKLFREHETLLSNKEN